jgi:hypothetical protein
VEVDALLTIIGELSGSFTWKARIRGASGGSARRLPSGPLWRLGRFGLSLSRFQLICGPSNPCTPA